MPGFGPAPAEQRRRTNPDSFGQSVTTVTAAPSDAPALPNRESFRSETQAWYDTWTTAPQAETFTTTDWQRLHMLALLVERYFESPTEKRFAEIRQNESLLGATHLDRLRGRIKVERPTEQAEPGSVANLADARRQRLMSDA